MTVANVVDSTQVACNLRSIDSKVLAKVSEHIFIRAQSKDLEQQLRNNLSQVLILDLVGTSNNLPTISLCHSIQSMCGKLAKEKEINLFTFAKRNIRIDVKQIWAHQIKSFTLSLCAAILCLVSLITAKHKAMNKVQNDHTPNTLDRTIKQISDNIQTVPNVIQQ